MHEEKSKKVDIFGFQLSLQAVGGWRYNYVIEFTYLLVRSW